MKKTILFSLLLAVSCAHRPSDNCTVILSLDAFRWDYPQIYETPSLDSIAEAGVSATMLPSYPASTFPNHYTLATGLVPDHHGIVNSQFWDTERGVLYMMGDSVTRSRPYYYGGEPVWATAQRQGLKTANIYWVGSDIPINGVFPTSYLRWYDEPRLDYSQRIAETLRLISLPEDERPSLVMTYFDDPDWTSHEFGPVSPETGAMAHYLDSLVGVLYRGIQSLPHADKVNLIVTADHGMTDISDERFIRISDYVKDEWCENIVSTNPTTFFCKPGCRDSVLNALSGVAHLNVWKSEDVPAELNYGTSDRLGDVIAAPDLGWQFARTPRGLLGAHGYFPEEPDMQVVFRACGPGFKKGYTLEEKFRNVDIYPLLSHLLGVEPVQTDGSLDAISPALAD